MEDDDDGIELNIYLSAIAFVFCLKDTQQLLC